MAERKELERLAERVERGETIPAFELRAAFEITPQEMAFWGLPDSLDACAALHEAVLGERWAWELKVCDDGGYQARVDRDVDDDNEHWGFGATPARAWLAAILRAAAAERREK